MYAKWVRHLDTCIKARAILQGYPPDCLQTKANHPPHYTMTYSLNQGATGLQTETTTSSTSHILSKHPNAQLTQKRPTPAACLTHKQPPTTFALYQQLPIELQLQIYQTSVAERVISLQPRYQYDMQLFHAPFRTPDSGLQHAITRDPSNAT
jgi:hypothetical protein